MKVAQVQQVFSMTWTTYDENQGRGQIYATLALDNVLCGPPAAGSLAFLDSTLFAHGDIGEQLECLGDGV